MRRILLLSDASPAVGMLLELLLTWQADDPCLQTEVLCMDGLYEPDAVAVGGATGSGGTYRIRDWLGLARFRRIAAQGFHACGAEQLPWALNELTRYTDLVLAPRQLLHLAGLNWHYAVQPYVHAPLLLPHAAEAAHPSRVLLFPDEQAARQVMQLRSRRLEGGEVVIVNCEPQSPILEKQLVAYVQAYCPETSYFLPEEATAAEVHRLLRPNTLLAGTIDPQRPSGRCLRALVDAEPQPCGLSFFLTPSPRPMPA